jgi:hypothetical protein
MDVVAHGYQHFRSFVDDETKMRAHSKDTGTCIFAGRQLELEEIPQYIIEYQRTDELELWEIWRK